MMAPSTAPPAPTGVPLCGIAYPVDEVEERTFRLRSRLTLNSYIELWVLTQVLSQDILRSQHKANRARR
jgi:hypothetical protein